MVGRPAKDSVTCLRCGFGRQAGCIRTTGEISGRYKNGIFKQKAK
jgi:hypothetical protein